MEDIIYGRNTILYIGNSIRYQFSEAEANRYSLVCSHTLSKIVLVYVKIVKCKRGYFHKYNDAQL